MKKILLFIILAVLLSFTVSAQLQAPEYVTVANNRNVNFQTSFTVKNLLNTSVNNTLFQLTSESKYQLLVSYDNMNYNTTFTLNFAPDETKTIFVKGYTPLSEISGINSIGSLRIVAGTNSSTITFREDIPSLISYKTVYVYVDGKKKTADNDVTIGKVDPLSTIQIKATVQNDYNETMDDVVVTALLFGLDDDGDDLEEDSDSYEIKPGRSRTFTFDFAIPKDAYESSMYYIDLYTEARDEKGGRHKLTWKIPFEIIKKTRDLKFVYVTYPDVNVSCDGLANVKFELGNFGNEDAEFVTINLTRNDKLVRSFYIANLRSDSDDGFFYNQVPLVNTENESVQDAEFLLSAYIKDRLYDQEIIRLNLSPCTIKPTTVITQPPVIVSPNQNTVGNNIQTSNENIIVKQPGTVEAVPVVTTEKTQYITTSENNNDMMYILFLVIGIVVVLVLILGLIMVLFKK